MFLKRELPFSQAKVAAEFRPTDNCLYSFLVLLFAFFAVNIAARPVYADDFLPSPSRYIAPNEYQPKDLLPILKRLKPGVYVSVGTERGFMAAGSSDHVTALELVDRDPSIILYNKINVALLKAANGNRKLYLKLRLSAPAWEWSSIFDQVDEINSVKLWRWWQENVRRSRFFISFHTPPSKLTAGKVQFDEMNYLYSDENFNRLSRLAEQNLIAIVQADLASADLPEILKSKLTPESRIAAIDMSNAWDGHHMGLDNTQLFIDNMKPTVDGEAILIATLQKGGLAPEYGYSAFHFSFVRRFASSDFVGRYLYYSEELIQSLKNSYTHLDGVAIGRSTNLVEWLKSCVAPLMAN